MLFRSYTLMQIPAGLLVDRYGVKRVVLVSMVASSLGSAAFALAPNLLDVFAARLIVACGDALVFTALLKLVAQSFADERFGMMSGISQVSGYVGGVIATTPLAAAVSGFGWRACFLFIVSGFPLVLDAFSAWAPQLVLDAIASLSFLTRFEAISKGVIDLRDLLYFISLMAAWLAATAIVVDLKKAD